MAAGKHTRVQARSGNDELAVSTTTKVTASIIGGATLVGLVTAFVAGRGKAGQ